MTSEHQPNQLDALTAALEEAAGRLRSGELSGEDAAALVERCAELAAEAGAELERLAREQAGQERLL